MASLCAVVFRVVVYAVFAQTLTYVANADVAAESRRWGTAAHLLGAVGCHTDRIQEAALREGAYFSGDVPRLYNTIEARACLRGKRVVFAGDSHSKQLFIGLVDVLQGEPSNVEIHSSRERNMHLEVAEATAASFLQLMGIHVSWNCSGARLPRGSCYGSTGDLDACRQCLNEINATFKVLSTTVHLVMTRVKAEFAKEKQLASETIKDAINENKKSACTTCCSCWSNASFEQGMVHDVVREISTTYLSVRGLVWGSGVSSSKDIIPMPYVAGLIIDAPSLVFC